MNIGRSIGGGLLGVALAAAGARAQETNAPLRLEWSAPAPAPVTAAPAPAATPHDPAGGFALARQAYDAGRFDEAVQRYDALLAAGYADGALWYNAGNARFRAGATGPAVLAYRRAWRQTPADPDVAANLAFALTQAGAPAPAYGRGMEFLLSQSRARWMRLAYGGYAAAVLLLMTGLLWRMRRGLFVRLAGLAAVPLALGLAGAAAWMRFDRAPEAVVMAKGREALFAPLADAKPHFAAPEGVIVRVVEARGDWRRVELGARTGWLKSADLTLVP